MIRHKLLVIGLLVFGLTGCSVMNIQEFRPKPRQHTKCKCQCRKCRHHKKQAACCCQTDVCIDDITPLFPGDMYGGGMHGAMMAPAAMGFPMMAPVMSECSECGGGMCGSDSFMTMPMSGMAFPQSPMTATMMPGLPSEGCGCGSSHSPMIPESTAPWQASPGALSPQPMQGHQIQGPSMQFAAPPESSKQVAPVAPMEAPKPVPPENNLPPVPQDANPQGAPPGETPIDPVGWNSISFPPMSSHSGNHNRGMTAQRAHAVQTTHHR